MDRRTATIITNLEECGFKNEARRILEASLKMDATTMPLYHPHQAVSLTYHNKIKPITGVVVAVGERRLTVASSAGKHDYLWTGALFEDVDASQRFSILVAILPESGE